MDLANLNALDDDAAVRELLRCCGSSRWAQAMADARPFASRGALEQAADACWRRLAAADMLEAFAAHPKIGEQQAGRPHRADRPAWSSQEQSGVRIASDDVRERLAAGNREYEARFGYIFIVCATGKSADAMLSALEARLRHTPAEELPIAAEEQRQITRLRLRKLVDGPVES